LTPSILLCRASETNFQETTQDNPLHGLVCRLNKVEDSCRGLTRQVGRRMTREERHEDESEVAKAQVSLLASTRSMGD